MFSHNQTLTINLAPINELFYISCLDGKCIYPVHLSFIHEITHLIVTHYVMCKCYWYSKYEDDMLHDDLVDTVLDKYQINMVDRDRFYLVYFKVENIIKELLAPYIPSRTWDVLSVNIDNYQNVVIDNLGDYRINWWALQARENPDMNPFNYPDTVLYNGGHKP